MLSNREPYLNQLVFHLTVIEAPPFRRKSSWKMIIFDDLSGDRFQRAKGDPIFLKYRIEIVCVNSNAGIITFTFCYPIIDKFESNCTVHWWKEGRNRESDWLIWKGTPIFTRIASTMVFVTYTNPKRRSLSKRPCISVAIEILTYRYDIKIFLFLIIITICNDNL